MPQASDELRERWGGRQGVGDDKAMGHLLRMGFTIDRGGTIHPPVGYSHKDDPTDCEGAINFLCDEWDYAYEPTEPQP